LGNDEKNKLTGAVLDRAIETICEGLVFISETDSALKPVFISKSDATNTEDAIAILSGTQTPEIAESSPDSFFARLTLDREWHDEREKAVVRRFRILKDILYTNLTGVRQYRIGRTRVTIFVIGVDDIGNIAGITTEAVET